MKKNALIQLMLIFAGITTFLSGFTYFIPRVLYLVGTFNQEKPLNNTEDNYLIIEIIRIVAGLILVLKSAGISEFISERVDFDDSLKIYTKPSQLFSILLIIIALSHLIEHGAFLLNGIILVFSGAPSAAIAGHAHAYTLNQWTVTISHVLIALFVIIFCKRLTRFFLKNIATDDDEIIIEHETITIETTDTL